MDNTENFRNFFVIITILVIGTILIPAVIVMGYLGRKIGEIVDNPKNRADADYRIAVLNALKKMDKSMTLQELNEKLTKTVSEPDTPDIPNDEDLDI